jgi:ribosome biogenesis GTP-binding protein YsxC/EngB
MNPTLPASPRAALSDVKQAHGWLHTARFLTTAPQLQHLPALDVPEVAFVGRSNAGKSTCINTITQQKRLAFASKTPGRTQSINLFSLGKQGQTDAVLADLPGYGYAAVPHEAKLRWQRVMANYLVTRPNLRGIVLLCDPRLGLTADQGRQAQPRRSAKDLVHHPAASRWRRGAAVLCAEKARSRRCGPLALGLDAARSTGHTRRKHAQRLESIPKFY